MQRGVGGAEFNHRQSQAAIGLRCLVNHNPHFFIAVVKQLVAVVKTSGRAQQYQAALNLAAVLGAGDDFLAGIAAFFKVYAANQVLVEHLCHAGFAAGRRNPRVAALQLMALPQQGGFFMVGR